MPSLESVLADLEEFDRETRNANAKLAGILKLTEPAPALEPPAPLAPEQLQAWRSGLDSVAAMKTELEQTRDRLQREYDSAMEQVKADAQARNDVERAAASVRNVSTAPPERPRITAKQIMQMRPGEYAKWKEELFGS